jgi:hypothetical protein
MFPRARREHLTVHELPDETLIYDRDRHRGHCLNSIAALVWRNCDGETSEEDLTHIVATRTGTHPAPELVRLAIEQLGRRNLLEEPPPSLPPSDRISRRIALKKLALAGCVLPLIMSIATKTAAQSMSGAASSTPSSTTSNPNVNVTVVEEGNPPHPVPCRTRGQSCVAAASGRQGTCCAGLACNGVSQNAGVCS